MTPSYVGGELPPAKEIIPFQFLTGLQTPPPLADKVTYGNSTYVPYQKQTNTTSADTTNFVKSESDQTTYLANLSSSIVNIVTNSSQVFSKATNKSSNEASTYTKLTDLTPPLKSQIANQVVVPKDVPVAPSIIVDAKAFYNLVTEFAQGRSRGLGRNSVQSDRIHIGF
jgi:hypothetical protein